MNGYTATPDPPPPLYVRALYNYDADDHTSLSFRQGDIIQVLTQLESGWWDGVINDVRGWFPSNYCAVVSGPDDPELRPHLVTGGDTSESGTEDEYDEDDGDVDSEGNPRDEASMLPIEGATMGQRGSRDQEEAAFWIPQATPDGRLFYFNTLTGYSTMELPLETPTSMNESGPKDRTNIFVPEQTRPPPEMMAGGFERDVDEYDESASEAEVDSAGLTTRSSLSRRRRSFISDGVSPATSMDSINNSPEAKAPEQQDPYGARSLGLSAVANNFPLSSSAAFAPNPTNRAPTTVPRFFFDDGATQQPTWARLVEKMRQSIDAYRNAINNGERAEFVRRAEDISDRLRMLLAAGSGTTDNHSGNSSIISTNKQLYPHFRDMMSKFSKLVISSHIAAADWPSPDSYGKCLQEAEGVMKGVYGFVEVARQQRGDDIPRLVPGFVHGGMSGGSWQNNNLSSRDPMNATSFMDQDDYEPYSEPTTKLDTKLLEHMDELRKTLIASIRRLDEHLIISDNLVHAARHRVIGDTLCAAASRVVENYRPWVTLLESIDLAPLGSTFQNPQVIEFTSQKQRIYDSIAELVMGCQNVAAPLGDEWSEIRGESLEDRAQNVRAVARQLETGVSQIGFSLQLLLDTIESTHGAFEPRPGHRLPNEKGHGRSGSMQLLNSNKARPTVEQHSQSYTLGSESPPEVFRRPAGKMDKAQRFFGQVPPPDVASARDAIRDLDLDVTPPEEAPWYLKLDHEGEVLYDMKADPPQIKCGTLEGLVEQLTRHDRLDAAFNSTFLLTYRSFTSAVELFEMLVRRFSIQPPYSLAKEEYPMWSDKKQKPIRMRVVNILKTWFGDFWMEGNDEASMRLLRRVHTFAKDSIATTKTPGSGPLMAVVDQRLKGQDNTAKRLVPATNAAIPPSIIPKNMKKLKFLDIDATEFARQLTIIESRLYGKIKPTECLNKTWQKKLGPDEPEPAPNVKALILHSNQLTNWVAEMILTQSDVKKRVVVIKHFVSVADVSDTHAH